MKKGLGIIFHSGSPDRVLHGLSLALTALASGGSVKLFFSYKSLEYLRMNQSVEKLMNEDKNKDFSQPVRMRILDQIFEFIPSAKAMGAKFYVCPASMGLLNISRDELREEVDKSLGETAFLSETSEDMILFI